MPETITKQLLQLMGDEYVRYITGASARDLDKWQNGVFDDLDALETIVFAWTIYERLYLATGRLNARAWLVNHKVDIKNREFNKVSQAARHWIEGK